MLHIDITSNIREVMARLSDIQKREIPFAAIVALTRTMVAVKQVEITEMQRVFDRPVPYTLNSVFVKPATKRDPSASVGFKEFGGKGTPAGKYLRPQIEGGGRNLKRFEKALQFKGLLPKGMYAVPGAGADIDAHGNMSAGQIVKILSFLRAFGEQGYTANRNRAGKSRGTRRRELYFVAAPGGAPLGVWKRTGTGITPVLVFVKTPKYQRRFPFREVAERVIAFQFGPQFDRALQETLRFKARVSIAA